MPPKRERKPAKPRAQRAQRREQKLKRRENREKRRGGGSRNAQPQLARESRKQTSAMRNSSAAAGPPVAVATVNDAAKHQPLEIKFTECVGDLTMTKEFSSSSFLVIPTNPELFPWLSRIARYGTTYQWNYARLRYAPNTATDVAGTVAIVNDADPDRPPQPNMKAIVNHEGSANSAPWVPMVTNMLNKSTQAVRRKFIEKFEDVAVLGASALGEGLHTIADGLVQVATEGLKSLFAESKASPAALRAMSDDTLDTGKVYVDYSIKIFDPVTSFDDDEIYFFAIAGMNEPASLSTPYVVAPVLSDGTPIAYADIEYADPSTSEDWTDSVDDAAAGDAVFYGTYTSDGTLVTNWTNVNVRDWDPGVYSVAMTVYVVEDGGLTSTGLDLVMTSPELIEEIVDGGISLVSKDTTGPGGNIVGYMSTKFWRLTVPDGLASEDIDDKEATFMVGVQMPVGEVVHTTAYDAMLQIVRLTPSAVGMLPPSAHARNKSKPMHAPLNDLFVRNASAHRTSAIKESVAAMRKLMPTRPTRASRPRVRAPPVTPTADSKFSTDGFEVVPPPRAAAQAPASTPGAISAGVAAAPAPQTRLVSTRETLRTSTQAGAAPANRSRSVK